MPLAPTNRRTRQRFSSNMPLADARWRDRRGVHLQLNEAAMVDRKG